MPVSASRARLESINRVALDCRPDERLQTAAVGDIDPDREQVREVLRNPDILEKPDRRLRVRLDQDVDVARARARASRNRAEQPRLANPAPAQLSLVSAQRRDEPFPGSIPLSTLVCCRILLILSSPVR